MYRFIFIEKFLVGQLTTLYMCNTISVGFLPGTVMEFSFNSTGCSIDRELAPYDFPFLVLNEISTILHLWCNMLGGSFWIWLKANIFWFIEDQTQHAPKWVWPSMDRHTYIQCYSLKSPHWLRTCFKIKTQLTWKVLHAKQPTPEQMSRWIQG